MDMNKAPQISNPLNGKGNIQLPDSMKFQNKEHHHGHHVNNAPYLNFRRKMRTPLFRGR